MNRKISTGTNLIKNLQTFISVRVPLETLATNVNLKCDSKNNDSSNNEQKHNYNNNNNNNDVDDNDNSNNEKRF